MTCIVGLVHNGVTYIGADSLGSNSYGGSARKPLSLDTGMNCVFF